MGVTGLLSPCNTPGCFSVDLALCGQTPWPHDGTDAQASPPSAGSSHPVASALQCGSETLPTAYNRGNKVCADLSFQSSEHHMVVFHKTTGKRYKNTLIIE